MRSSTDPPSPGGFSRPAARLERYGEPGGEHAHGDVVEAAARAANLLREAALELGRHPDEDVFAAGC
jgi:hypothetical protein